MKKQTLYVAFFNSLLGIVLSLLLKGNLLIYGLTFIVLLTIIFIERQWIFEKIFKRRKGRAVLGYLVMLALMIGFLILLTQPNRDTYLIVQATHQFLDHIHPGEYEEAYKALSEVSKRNYSENDFTSDHDAFRITIQDYRIDEVLINEFDKKKAVVKVSSPFSMYGQNSLNLEVVNDKSGWHVAFSPSMIDHKSPLVDSRPDITPQTLPEEHKPGFIRRLFRKIF